MVKKGHRWIGDIYLEIVGFSGQSDVEVEEGEGIRNDVCKQAQIRDLPKITSLASDKVKILSASLYRIPGHLIPEVMLLAILFSNLAACPKSYSWKNGWLKYTC